MTELPYFLLPPITLSERPPFIGCYSQLLLLLMRYYPQSASNGHLLNAPPHRLIVVCGLSCQCQLGGLKQKQFGRLFLKWIATVINPPRVISRLGERLIGLRKPKWTVIGRRLGMMEGFVGAAGVLRSLLLRGIFRSNFFPILSTYVTKEFLATDSLGSFSYHNWIRGT